jgi:methionine-gamma-lyase
MNGDGGSVLAFDLVANNLVSNDTLVDKFLDQLKIFSLTPSMGCVESLVAPCLQLFGDDFTGDELKSAGINARTIRLAIGIESCEDLIADLNQALAR